MQSGHDQVMQQKKPSLMKGLAFVVGAKGGLGKSAQGIVG
jgi:hypothetical protein